MILGIVLWLVAADLQSAPKFWALQSTSGDDALLAMECEGAKPFDEIRCHFRELTLRIPDQTEVEKKLAKKKGEFAKASPELLTGLVKQMCTRLPEEREQKATTPGRQASFAWGVASGERTCLCKERDCIVSEILKGEEEFARACEVVTNHWDLTMRRTGARSWVADKGPNGSCDVSTLEQEPENEDHWMFTSVRASDPSCAGPEVDKTNHFIWNVGGGVYLGANCRKILLMTL